MHLCILHMNLNENTVWHHIYRFIILKYSFWLDDFDVSSLCPQGETPNPNEDR